MDEATGERRWRQRSARWWIGGPLLAAGLAATIVWVERRPIATHFIDRQLAKSGVPARYVIADLGLFSQRLTNVVIGDPAHPDLVADRIDVTTEIGLGGPSVTAIHAGQVRLRAAVEGGQLRLGALDRLAPQTPGRPFALPKLWVSVDDARVRLATPLGVIGGKIAGQGRLDDGFAGRVALIADRLGTRDCSVERIAAVLKLRMSAGRPAIAGPLRAAGFGCGGAEGRGAKLVLDATFGERLDRWRGTATVTLDRLTHPAARVAMLAGTISADGGPSRSRGRIDLHSGAASAKAGQATALTLAGDYEAGRIGLNFDGRAEARGASAAAATRAAIARWASAGEGTPVAPLLRRAAAAAGAAARRFDLRTGLALASASGGYRIALADADAVSAGGARATLTHGAGIAIGADGVRIDGLLALGGGGLPEAVLRLAQASAGAPVRGTGFVRPYATGGARLALSDIDFTAAPGGTRIVLRAEISGPFAGGRIDAARLPIEAIWDGGRRLSVNRHCAPLSFAALHVGNVTLGATRAALCPLDGALIAIDNAGVRGGARIARLALAGRTGETPLAATGEDVRYDLADNRLAIRAVNVRLGDDDQATRIDIGSLAGGYRAGALAGDFADAAGRIGTVPLLLSQAKGSWRFADGALAVAAGLTVADADAAPRFNPLVGRDVTLALADGRITVRGTLAEPGAGTRIADVAITHDLASESGHADLAVPGITFTEGFQPERLTRLTYGVIADVRGTVTGAGRIAWAAGKVTSSGRFRTDAADLAAAFGPVTGLSGEIAFTDLLALQSAPGQELRVATVNPGVPVTGGVVRYQTLADQRLRIEGGRWPFAGGQLVLEPTEFDLGDGAERRLTFRVEGVDAAQFLQEFEFKNLDATGTFDGVLPMVFDARGGRIVGGNLVVREAGGRIAYVGAVSQKDLGFWGNTAFQALKSLRYRRLAIEMNGPIDGEMVTEVRFAGVTQGEGAKSNFLVRRLQRLPFVFNVKITAPFRQLIDSAASYYDPRRLIERNLPALIEEQNRAIEAQRAVQPRASEPMPQGDKQ